MRLGLLADIHANTQHLAWALGELERAGAESFVVLGDIANVFGDVAETRKSLRETVEMLTAVGAIGVWGNHDAGFCCSPEREFLAGYDATVVRYMSSLHPRLEIEDCLFTHVEPWLDPHDPDQLWHYDGWPDNVRRASRSFAAAPQRCLFFGHFHYWMAMTPRHTLNCSGQEELELTRGQRFLVCANAVSEGCCALLDTSRAVLRPFVNKQVGNARK